MVYTFFRDKNVISFNTEHFALNHMYRVEKQSLGALTCHVCLFYKATLCVGFE